MLRLLLVISVSILSLLLVGCAGSDSPTATPTPQSTTSDDTVQAGANRPSAPAGEDYRPDPVSWVANSGYPQLVEVFSYD
ncbi:MAG: hypothetical protein CUN52_01800 [Phototrophicales bacterium]|jgi:hypothetical protein|nr:MAG: hypothetical protein CUN52_01800 [Phototrophicales bacterium]